MTSLYVNELKMFHSLNILHRVSHFLRNSTSSLFEYQVRAAVRFCYCVARYSSKVFPTLHLVRHMKNTRIDCSNLCSRHNVHSKSRVRHDRLMALANDSRVNSIKEMAYRCRYANVTYVRTYQVCGRKVYRTMERTCIHTEYHATSKSGRMLFI